MLKAKITGNAEPSTSNSSPNTSKKHVFVSKTVGLIKRKKHQTFKCTKCDKRSLSLAELNTHYRANHAKVKCKYCNLLFNTLSSLARHQYSHEIATKCCRCGKLFRFDSELKAHKLKHRRIPTQHCSHPNCNRTYFSASDLAKHAKIHENVVWNCDKCDYSTNDKRLLKSHRRKHEQKPKYSCTKCGKSFIYHTQWSQHKNNHDCE